MDIVTMAATRITEGKGFSINLTDGTEPVDGYMVAADGGELRVLTGTANADLLRRFMVGKVATSNLYLGCWITPDSTACLDYSERYEDLYQALTVAKARHQQAIWDIVAVDDIYVDYSDWV